ncbi:MAG: hypothetical protein LBV61_08775 [Burkholderiaceae bacterium]|jgi:hypothetical protein|nr:hypothetical protein [Burkholderiaceae bacterium]
MVAPAAAVVIVAATLTLKSDTKPVTVYIQKPRGTLYWGGAGLDGDYIQPQLQAFIKAGIKNVNAGLTNTGGHGLPKFAKPIGTLIDAIRAGLPIRYEDGGEWTISKGMDAKEGQFNLIGYSYGSLLAAQTAHFYAKQGHIIDHLVLIASPIDADFLAKLQNSKNIRKVTVINLTDKGDPLYAGISQMALFESIPKLSSQFASKKGEGHFYYADVIPNSSQRWKALAEKVFNEGVR